MPLRLAVAGSVADPGIKIILYEQGTKIFVVSITKIDDIMKIFKSLFRIPALR